MRYQIAGDGSGHEYAIPCANSNDWYTWLASDGADLGGEPPEWAIRIDGRFTFTDPKCE